MIVWLAGYLSPYYSGFNLFQYITFRAIASMLTALAISLFVGPFMIRRLKAMKVGQVVRDDGPKTHFSKAGTPTMGGALILVALAISTLLWSRLDNYYVWVVLLTTLFFGAIGWVDDYRKIVYKDPKGLTAGQKIFWQSLGALIAALVLYQLAELPQQTTLYIPFFKDFSWQMGSFFIVLTYFVIVGTSNAVNLTDGLDGLAIMPTILVGGALGLFCYVTGHSKIAEYLYLSHIPLAGELTIFCAALAGSGLGFLWFNTYPAQVFMGDVGALALGAALGIVAVCVRQELVLFIMGGIFVMETVSVVLQVGSFKLRGKRVFKMAPIHHHFEEMGWPEPRVIIRFWIITVILVLIGLASLKVR